MKRTRLMARHRTDGAGKVIENSDDSFRIPVFKVDIVNPSTPDEMIVQRADDKVFQITPAFRPFTRWLLNTGWFDGKKKK
jgi:hypothetical protein